MTDRPGVPLFFFLKGVSFLLRQRMMFGEPFQSLRGGRKGVR